jgi:hypothetical protein
VWPRSLAHELPVAMRFEQVLADTCGAGGKSTLGVVCFPLGTWVGGMYTTMACRWVALKGYPLTIATPGNNAAEILKVVRELGGSFEQVVLFGYAPFLKDVVDSGHAQGVDWRHYDVKLASRTSRSCTRTASRSSPASTRVAPRRRCRGSRCTTRWRSSARRSWSSAGSRRSKRRGRRSKTAPPIRRACSAATTRQEGVPYGLVRQGFAGDLLVVEGNPITDNFKSTRRIRDMYRAGYAVQRHVFRPRPLAARKIADATMDA